VAKLFVKLRFADFTQTTVECVGTAPLLAQFAKLMETGYLRRSRAVRLLGVGVRLGEPVQPGQLLLFGDAAASV
jgi:DNA polymerase-4